MDLSISRGYLDYGLILLIKKMLDESDRSMDGLYEIFGNNRNNYGLSCSINKGVAKLIHNKFCEFKVEELKDLLIMNVKVDHTPYRLLGENKAELKDKFKSLLICY